MKLKGIIYSIEVARLDYSGLKVLDIKIGKTANLHSTLSQYKRSSRNVKILDLWKPNKSLSLSDCEEGIHQLAEQYAYERNNEKFIFLQQSYDKFSENVAFLLEKTTRDEFKRIKGNKLQPKNSAKRKGIKIGGDFFPCRHAREVLVNTANWLIDQRAIKKKDIPIKSGKVRYIINKKPVHQNGNEFFDRKKLSDGNYIELHNSKKRCIGLAKKLLYMFSYSKKDLEIIGF